MHVVLCMNAQTSFTLHYAVAFNLIYLCVPGNCKSIKHKIRTSWIIVKFKSCDQLLKIKTK